MRTGYSLYDSRIDAAMFLLKTFLKMLYRKNAVKQLAYLLEHDFLSDPEWALHLECKWSDIMLGENTIN